MRLNTILRTPDQKKRRELKLIVRDVLKNGDREKYRLEWDKTMLYGQLSVGYLVQRGNGHVMSLHTLNNRASNCLGLDTFNAVDITVTKEDSRMEVMAYQIGAELQEKGYSAAVKSMK